MTVPDSPTYKMLLNPIHAFSLGFGSGLAPYAPGTWGTLVAYPFYFLMLPLGALGYAIVLALLIAFSCYACGYTTNTLGTHDHKSIVCDEIVGYLLVLMFTPKTPLFYFISFILFRIFDIFKPWPISWCDKNIKNGTGIVLDDLLAAIYAILIVLTLSLASASLL
jgi:phosphatidylglycerophosphatase A